jgi:hypothetical protein
MGGRKCLLVSFACGDSGLKLADCPEVLRESMTDEDAA